MPCSGWTARPPEPTRTYGERASSGSPCTIASPRCPGREGTSRPGNVPPGVRRAGRHDGEHLRVTNPQRRGYPWCGVPSHDVGGKPMVKVALFVRLEAKPGKEADVAAFLKGGLPVVEEEPATIAWFGIRLGPTTFGIFDAFPDEQGRQAHLSGRVAAALMAKADELLASPPAIEKVDVLAAKLP